MLTPEDIVSALFIANESSTIPVKMFHLYKKVCIILQISVGRVHYLAVQLHVGIFSEFAPGEVL